MTPQEWIAHCDGVKCAHCRAYIAWTDLGVWHAWLDSNGSAHCRGPRGIHWPPERPS